MNYTAEEAPQGVTGGRSPLLGVCSRRMFSLLLLLLIVFLPLVAQLSTWDTLAWEKHARFFVGHQLDELFFNHIQLQQPTRWEATMFSYYWGISGFGGHSLTWNLLLQPLFFLFGFIPEVFNLACLCCHLLFSFTLFRWSRRRPQLGSPHLILALVILTPWYQATMFSGTFLSLSLALSLVLLLYFFSATKDYRRGKVLLLGLLCGLNLYSYLVFRVYSLLVLFTFLGLLVFRRPAHLSDRQALLRIGLFFLGCLAPLHVNLAEPFTVLGNLFADNETVLHGSLMWAHHDIAHGATLWSPFWDNLLVHFFNYQSCHNPEGIPVSLRYHTLELDVLLFLCWCLFLGKYRTSTLLLLSGFSAAMLILPNLLMYPWSVTRIGGVALPFLLAAALGFSASIAAPLPGKRARGVFRSLRFLFLCAVLVVLLLNNLLFYRLEQRRDPLLDFAETITRQEYPFKTVILLIPNDSHHGSLNKTFLWSVSRRFGVEQAQWLNLSTLSELRRFETVICPPLHKQDLDFLGDEYACELYTLVQRWERVIIGALHSEPTAKPLPPGFRYLGSTGHSEPTLTGDLDFYLLE